MHVEEYRFQLQVNNQRFQWYTALDVGIVTVGTGLLGTVPDHGRILTSLIFITGAFLAVFTAIATGRQVGYQHRARAQALKVAEELGVAQLAIGSTPGWIDEPPPRGWTKVRSMNYALLGVLGVMNLAGLALAIWA